MLRYPRFGGVSCSDKKLCFQYEECRFGDKTCDLIQNNANLQKRDTELSQSSSSSEDGWDTDLEQYGLERWETALEDVPFDCDTEERDIGDKEYLQNCSNMSILPSFSVLRQLKTDCLVLSHWAMRGYEFNIIMKALASNCSVTKLKLQGNCLDCNSIVALRKMLRKNKSITEIDLSDNMIGNSGGIYIGKIIKETKYLETLIVSGNKFDDSKVSEIADGIAVNNTLKALNLSHNQFMSSAGRALGLAIEMNRSIEDLDLSWNHFRMEGAVDFSFGVALNKSLVVVNLSFNGFADIGAKAMGNALSKNDTLKQLDLSHNRITNNGATALSKGLSKNKNLSTLNIGFNPISQGGSLALIKAVGKAKTITEMVMEEIYVGESGIHVIQEIMTTRDNVKFVYRGITRNKEMSPKEDLELVTKNICSIITKYLRDNNLRMLDLFNKWDKDKSLSLSPLEFVIGCRTAKIALSQDMLDVLIATLDKNNDGEITYTEFVSVTRIR